jgi:hypothetical protein
MRFQRCARTSEHPSDWSDTVFGCDTQGNDPKDAAAIGSARSRHAIRGIPMELTSINDAAFRQR